MCSVSLCYTCSVTPVLLRVLYTVLRMNGKTPQCQSSASVLCGRPTQHKVNVKGLAHHLMPHTSFTKIHSSWKSNHTSFWSFIHTYIYFFVMNCICMYAYMYVCIYTALLAFMTVIFSEEWSSHWRLQNIHIKVLFINLWLLYISMNANFFFVFML